MKLSEALQRLVLIEASLSTLTREITTAGLSVDFLPAKEAGKPIPSSRELRRTTMVRGPYKKRSPITGRKLSAKSARCPYAGKNRPAFPNRTSDRAIKAIGDAGGTLTTAEATKAVGFSVGGALARLPGTVKLAGGGPHAVYTLTAKGQEHYQSVLKAS